MTTIQYANKAWEIMRDLHLAGEYTKADFEFCLTIGAVIRDGFNYECAQIDVNFKGELWHSLDFEEGKVTISQWWGQGEPLATETINL